MSYGLYRRRSRTQKPRGFLYSAPAGVVYTKTGFATVGTAAFGVSEKTSGGGSTVNVGITGTGAGFLDSVRDSKSGIRATPVVGTINKGWMYLDGNGGGTGTATQRMAVYSDSSGSPTTLLGSSNDVNVADGAAAAWVAFTFSTPITISSTSPIWLAVHWGNPNARIGFTYPDTPDAVYSNIDTDVFSDGSETPWNMSGSTLFNATYAIYVEVTVAGGAGTTYTKAGYGTAGLVASGADVDVAVETGFATVVAVAIGASASVFVEAGFAVAGSVASGPSASVYTKSGFATVGSVASGADVDMAAETGFATVGAVASGVGSKAGSNAKTGYATSGLVATGADVDIAVETGLGVVGAVAAGASARVFTKAGSATANSVASGPSASVNQEAGAAIAGTLATGDANSVFVEAGAGIAGLAASGPGTKEGGATKTGFGTVGAVATGASASVFAKAGFAAAGLAASASNASVYVESGSAAAILTARGARAVVYTETGFAVLQGTGSGVRVTAHEYHQAGHGIAGLRAFGGRLTHFDPEPPGHIGVGHHGHGGQGHQGRVTTSIGALIASAHTGKTSRAKKGTLV